MENSGIRSIARALSLFYKQKIYYQTVAKWLKKAGEILEEIKKIEVLEIDEIVTFCKKNFVKFGYGLQLTEIGTKLLILSQRSAKPSMKSFKMDISKTCSKT